MAESLESDFLPTANPVAAPAVPIRFCRRCGQPLRDEGAPCDTCAAKVQHVIAQAERDQLSVAEKRSLIQAIALYCSMLAVSVLAMLVSIGQGHDLTPPQFVFEEVAFVAVIIGWCIASFRSLLQPLSRIGSWKLLAAAPLLGCGTYVIATSLLSALDHLIHLPTIHYLDEFEHSSHPFLLGVLLICVEPAIFEELAFRGVIFSALRRTLGGNGETIFVSAAMFAILHLSAASFPHLFVMGIVLAWLRARTGSLFPGMVVHFTHNFLCIASEQIKGLSW